MDNDLASESSEVDEDCTPETPRKSSRNKRRSRKGKEAAEAQTATEKSTKNPNIMPAGSAQKRVKNKKIERAFIIGSEAWPLDDSNRKPDTPPDHTKGWRVYVKTPEGQPDISRWLKKASFKIFHTYPNPQRLVENPPFQIEETGWGGFNVDIRLFFVPEVSSKPEYRMHFLQLEPYGDEAAQEQQKAEGIVRSEFLDYVEFNEPTEALWDLLTSEEQFHTGKKGRGKGKGKQAKGFAAEEDGLAAGQRTVELPEYPSQTNPFSKEMERQLIEKLTKAEAEVDKLLAEEKEKGKAAREELARVKATM